MINVEYLGGGEPFQIDSVRFPGRKLWVKSSIWRDCAQYELMVAPASGGAYIGFCTITFEDSRVKISLGKVWGNGRDSRLFEYCDPSFPSNLIDLIKAAADNSYALSQLRHKWHWNKYIRGLRKFKDGAPKSEA